VLDSLISDPGGTDHNAVADFNNGSRFAVAEINAHGGLGGQQIVFKAIETPPTGDAVVNSLNLALEDKPVALLGPVSSTALLAITAKVDSAGIPMIHNTTEPKAVHNGAAGSKWIFANRPSNDGAAAVAAKYAIEVLGAKKIGLMYVNSAFGQSGANAQKAAITAVGASLSGDQSFEYNATDLTNAALAMGGADAILDWGTPATVGLAVNTLAQQGLAKIPHIGPGSIGFSFFTAIVGDAKLLDGVLGVLDCNPIGDDRPEAKAFVAAYTSQYGSPPSYAAAEQYDAVYTLKYVIDHAGKDDPDSIRQGLESLNGLSGVCSTDYNNVNGVLSHSVVVAKFVGGKLVTQKEYTVD
jgi:branched-chain amino acid transport system substrate-binding protein